MIFISYRIQDSLAVADRLDADLSREFGEEVVFRDKSRIRGGDSWPQTIESNARSRKVMLVIIGEKWHSITFDRGQYKGFPRLHDSDDWVRKEISISFAAGNFVIPVLLDGVEMPPKEWLANFKLQELHSQQGVVLRAANYAQDLTELVKSIRTCCLEVSSKGNPAENSTAQWQSAVLYPLQPAPNFVGRIELLSTLRAWTNDPLDPRRVVALVAPGGTGKTAIAEQMLRTVARRTHAGTFVWSFYENPQTEAFLREACQYFVKSGESQLSDRDRQLLKKALSYPERERFLRENVTDEREFQRILSELMKGSGGFVERLQRGLSGSVPHILILDGMELVQSDGRTGRPRGQIEDPLLRRFMSWLAAGLGTRAKALITTRFPIPDLVNWRTSGFESIDLSDLDSDAARAVLQRWRINGTDAELDRLNETVHFHALTVDVLGSYLSNFCDGDVSQAPSFDIDAVSIDDLKTAKLLRVLEFYSQKLSTKERDLLARLSVFPHGVRLELLIALTAGEEQIAGSLSKCDNVEVKSLLIRLKSLGLIFRFGESRDESFTAHPFIRLFFQGILGKNLEKEIHGAVARQVSLGLNTRPGRNPATLSELNRYEELVELTRSSGQLEKAYEVYERAMGGNAHLGTSLGDYARGFRIVAAFSTDGTPSGKPDEMARSTWANLLLEWGSYAMHLGDLDLARSAFKSHADFVLPDRHLERSRASQQLVLSELVSGRYVSARASSVEAVSYAYNARNNVELAIARSFYRAARVALGSIVYAQHDYPSADALIPRGDFLHAVLLTYEPLLCTKDAESAYSVINRVLKFAEASELKGIAVMCLLVLGLSQANETPDFARLQLNAGREFASKTGDVEVALRCYQLASAISQNRSEFSVANDEAIAGLNLAEDSGYLRWEVECHLELAKCCFSLFNWRGAVLHAEAAISRAKQGESEYFWGIAVGSHLAGAALSRLGSIRKASENLYYARSIFQRIGHRDFDNTVEEIVKLEAAASS